MRNRVTFLLIIFCIILCCAGCASTIVMPYSSEEYENSGWTLKELTTHFEELGFTDVTVRKDTTRNEAYAGIYSVEIEEDTDSLFAEYGDFEKGDDFLSTRELYIVYNDFIPTWAIDNCPELVELSQFEHGSDEWEKKQKAFMQSHSGEYIEFDGVITDWYDDYWYAGGVSFTISVEGYEQLKFSWDNIELSSLRLTEDYHYSNYKTGLICEGDRVHILAKINYSAQEGATVEIESFILRK